MGRGLRRRPLLGATLLLLLHLAPAADSSPRTFANPSLNLGFEVAGPGLPAGWSANRAGGFDVATDTSAARTGSRSVRITSVAGGRFGSLSRRMRAAPLVGRRVRLHGWVRTTGVTGWAVVFLRVDGGQATYVMSDGPLGTSSDWSEIVADAMIAPGRDLTFGVALGGDGTAWFDDLSLEVVEPRREVPIRFAGRVVDATGAPVAGAEVALVDAGGMVARHARTSANGAFDFRANSGKWALSAHAPGRSDRVGAFLEAAEHASDAAPTLTLADTGGVTVRGRVPGPVPDGARLRVAAYSNHDGDVWAVPLRTDGTFATVLPRADRFAISVISGGAGRGDARRVGDVAEAVLDAAFERPAPDSVVSWISRHAIPLGPADPAVPLRISEDLRALIGPARVVALGEATHGTREFLRMKHRLFRALVAEGFSVFALEAGQVEARAVNDYVLHGTGTARGALGGLGVWVWETEEILELIEWMRAWNADPARTPRLQFVGFDMQSPIASLKAVRRYLEIVAPGEAAAWVQPIEVLAHESGSAGFAALSGERQAEVVATVDSIVGRFDRLRRAWESATSPAAYAVARQDARILQQATQQFASGTLSAAGSERRDRAMAENIQWLREHLDPGARMVVSAHNLHIADLAGRMGRPLRAALGDDWRTIGFELGEGTFQALHARTDGARPNIEAIRLSTPRDGQASAAFLRAGPGVYALDLRTLPAFGPAAEWFRSPQIVREVGYTFHSEATLTTAQSLAARYDALLFVARTTRARQLPVDFTRFP